VRENISAQALPSLQTTYEPEGAEAELGERIAPKVSDTVA